MNSKIMREIRRQDLKLGLGGGDSKGWRVEGTSFFPH